MCRNRWLRCSAILVAFWVHVSVRTVSFVLLLSFLFRWQSVSPVLSSDIPAGTESEEDEDGMNDMNEEVMSLIWSEDLRVQEVRRLLQSARPVRVNVVQMPEASDHEYIEEKENRYKPSLFLADISSARVKSRLNVFGGFKAQCV